MFFRQTWLKRLWSEIFGLNILDTPDVKINENIQPVVQVQPSIDIVRSDATGNATVYTTPTTKDFYLTNLAGSAGAEAGGGALAVTISPADGASQVINLVNCSSTAATLTSNAIVFPNRGILLKRGSTISYTCAASVSCLTIAGYTAGDR